MVLPGTLAGTIISGGGASVLAQDAGAAVSIVGLCLILVALLLVGFFAVAWLRRWLRRGDDVPAGGFTLGDLRALHKSGKISTEEFERTKSQIVGALRQAAAREAEAAKSTGSANKIGPQTPPPRP